MPDNPRQPASTIKIVTAMIALKSLRNDDVINVSRHAADMPSSKIFLETSKNYQADDLINAVLLASANDASVALAEKIAGSEDKFATLMTISAKMWGAKNTVCRTASGLTAVGQQSTARDLANLFRFAMQHDEFASRMREKFIRTSYGKNLRNHNKALWRLDGAVGGKTGYTVAARQTYVGQFTRDGQSIVVAIMGSESMWADLEKLVNYGFRKKKQEQLAQATPGEPGKIILGVN
jgi:D-alanyl-D-alanine carboxypeptidase (penicillin-binding protein 5/6)